MRRKNVLLVYLQKWVDRVYGKEVFESGKEVVIAKEVTAQETIDKETKLKEVTVKNQTLKTKNLSESVESFLKTHYDFRFKIGRAHV